MQVLDEAQINQKIKRLSFEIIESNLDESTIILAGINKNGYRFAKLLKETLDSITQKTILLHHIHLHAANPLAEKITTDIDLTMLQQHPVIIIDDVANTGRTIFYACKVIMEVLVKKVEVAVLVNRKHKLFPINVDYVGLTLATTIQEHIEASLEEHNSKNVVLV